MQLSGDLLHPVPSWGCKAFSGKVMQPLPALPRAEAPRIPPPVLLHQPNPPAASLGEPGPAVTAARERQEASKTSSLCWEHMLFPSANDLGGRNLTQNFLLKSSSSCSGQSLLEEGFWLAGVQGRVEGGCGDRDAAGECAQPAWSPQFLHFCKWPLHRFL